MKKINKSIFFLLGALFIFLIGCQNMNQFSPEQVIANALGESDETTYYGEMKVTSNSVEELDNTTIKEWRDGEKTRMEFTSPVESTLMVYDGKTLYLLEEMEEKAMIFEGFEEGDFHMDPREQIETLLKTVQDTHEIETVGEEVIAGRDTIHMVATKPDDVKSLYGDQEWWVDKENWFLLKVKSMSGDDMVDMEYTKIDFDVKIEDSLFEFDVPEGVEVEQMDHEFEQGEDITLEEIPEKLNQAVFYIPDGETHEIDSISYIEIEGETAYKDVTIDYKQNSLPLMSLTMVQVGEEDHETEEAFAALEDFGETLTIRGEKGVLLDEASIRHISWTEAGINYSIHLINPNLIVDDVLTWTEEMEEIN